jgi:hypothetical protein
MVAFSRPFPPELSAFFFADLHIEELLKTALVSHAFRRLVDDELQRRLRVILLRFMDDEAVDDFLELLEASGLAVTGCASLHLLLFGRPESGELHDQYDHLELAVPVPFFEKTVEFFEKRGYNNFSIDWTTPQQNEDDPSNLVAFATAFDLSKVSHPLISTAYLAKPYLSTL